MLDLRRLRLLSELARRDTITQVARAVGYTPSAVSQSLSRLEREVGVTLLERDGRRVRLTAAAHALVASTDRVLAELDAAEAELAAEQGTVQGEVVIGSFPSAASGLVVPAVARLELQHPELSCSVREHEPEDGIPLLRSGDLDLLISESYTDVDAAPAGGLASQPLLDEPLRLAFPASRCPAEPVSLGSLEGATWVAGLAGTQFAAALERACHSAGFTPRIAHRADDALLLHALVRSGLGVALLPNLACLPTEGVGYQRVTPKPPRRLIRALYRQGAQRRPAISAALQALCQDG